MISVRGMCAMLSLLPGVTLACDDLTLYLPDSGNYTCVEDYLLQTGKNNRPLQAVYRISASGKHYRVLDRSREFDGQYLDGQAFEFASLPGMDRGHLASEKLPDVNYHARFDGVNRVPMAKDINRAGGAWHQLEDFERSQSNRRGEILVLSGIIYNGKTPNAYYKIMIQPDIEAAAAFLVPNVNGTQRPLEHYVTSIRCIEERAGRAVIDDSVGALNDIADNVVHSLSVWTQGDGEISSVCTPNQPVALSKGH